MKRGILSAVFVLFLTGCPFRAPVSNRLDITQTRARFSMDQHSMELRLSKPKVARNHNLLVVYATGDGGWRGLDEQIFKWISEWNYPAVGFSSKNYLASLEYIQNVTTPRRLARDFRSIIHFAQQKLEMPEGSRIVLVGLSRGAGLSVVAAGEGELNSSLAGVVAIALTREEEHVVHYRHRTRTESRQAAREPLMIQTYEYLPRIVSVPVTVLQSTHDGYLPADEARTLFGPDTAMRKLVPIDAFNHSFSGGSKDLYRETEAALERIRNFVQRPIPQ